MRTAGSRPIGEVKQQRIIELLKGELPMPAIAERMGVNRAVVIGVNRRYRIREYVNRHTWRVHGNL